MNALEKIDATLKGGVFLRFKELGFKKKGLLFYKELENGEILHLVEVEKDPFNSKEKAGFSINFGVCIPEVCKILGSSNLPKIPDLLMCVNFEFISTLAKKNIWNVNTETDLEGLKGDVLTKIEKYIVPWFEEREDLTVCHQECIRKGADHGAEALIKFMKNFDFQRYKSYISSNS